MPRRAADVTLDWPKGPQMATTCRRRRPGEGMMARERRTRSSDRDRDASYGCQWMPSEGPQRSRGRCRRQGAVELDFPSRRRWRRPEGLKDRFASATTVASPATRARRRLAKHLGERSAAARRSESRQGGGEIEFPPEGGWGGHGLFGCFRKRSYVVKYVHLCLTTLKTSTFT